MNKIILFTISLFLVPLFILIFLARDANAADSGYFIKTNSHTHTAWDNAHGYGSDGQNTLAEMVTAYKLKGYNLLVITDHNSYDGAKKSSLTQGYFENRVNPFTPCESYSDPANKFLCTSGEELTPGIGISGNHAHHAVLVGGKNPLDKTQRQSGQYPESF
jgi:PHP domain.